MSAETSETENHIGPSEQCRRDELRATYEGFEFRVPATGRVLVTNVSYGEEEKENHHYVVTVEDGTAWECTCPHHQHRSARCKHILATEDREAVIIAASVER